MYLKYSFLLIILITMSCEKMDPEVQVDPIPDQLYFPPIDQDTWETMEIDSLDWNSEGIDELYSYLESNNSRAFILLKNGKIALEKYWGKDISTIGDFNKNSQWYWASAGKTVTSTLVGIAQQEGELNIDNPSSTYLGSNWTSLTAEKEELITVKHQLTMSTGLDYTIGDNTCTDPICLQYKQDAGTQWFYHNAPYTLLQDVISKATNTDFATYTNQKLEVPIGMKNGTWVKIDNNSVYWSSPRDMARFGLLISNKGTWGSTSILSDLDYYNSMVNSSQEMNPSYGYLWWLNGKNSIIYPSIASSFNLELASEAPDDLYAAMGKNGQFIDIVPSEDIVVIRMGEAPGNSAIPLELHNEMWRLITKFME